MNDKLTVGELVYKISGDMDNLKTELKKAEAQIGTLSKSMEKSTKATSGMTGGFGLLKTAVIGFITGALVNGIKNLAQSGAQLNVLQNSFSRLSAGIGLNSNEVLANLQKLSSGTISNKDLILSANRAIVLGVAKDMGEFSTLMQVARIRASDMGISTQQAFDNIVTGIGRSSPLILDNLGIVIKQQEAYDQYAKSLGKASNALTVNEQREAIKFAVLENGRKQIEEVGEVSDSYADTMTKVSVAIQNTKDKIGIALLPAMKLLVTNMFDTNISSEDMAKSINVLGREFYRVAQVLIVVGRSFVQMGKVVKIAYNGIHNTFNAGASLILKGSKVVGDALGKDTTVISDAMGVLAESSKENLNDIGDAMDDMGTNSDKFNHAMEQVFNPTDYKPVTAEMVNEIKAMSGATDDAGASADDAGDKIKEFQSKLVSLVNSATKARSELETKLGDSFKKFGDDIRGNFQDTVDNLAQIVVGAEEKIKSLKEQMGGTDDPEQRADLKKQIKEQQAILDSREDFEKRQADRITAIRAKLEEAGIDASKAGIDNLLNVRSLEEQIEEERRVASLNDFQKFEEEQSRKLLLLTDGFITETVLLQEKIETQKGFEADLTSYLLSENSKRLDGTDAWASATIEKYKEVADSLRNLLSMQAQIKGIQTSATPSKPYSTPNTASTGKSGASTTNNNVNAPVTINGQNIQNFSAKELSAILGFELNKFIR